MWGNHKCRIDRVLTRGAGSPWWQKEDWECGSDDTIIEAKVEADSKIISRKEICWDKVKE